MTDEWQDIATAPPFNTPLWALHRDRSMMQVIRVGDMLVTPKAGYQYTMTKFTHWTLVPDLPK